jgi:hypothetical protein
MELNGLFLPEIAICSSILIGFIDKTGITIQTIMKLDLYLFQNQCLNIILLIEYNALL